MTQPLTRDKTYVDGVTSVDAAELNRNQDVVIGGMHGSIDEIIRFSNAAQTVGAWSSTPPGLMSPAATAVIERELNYPVGTTITNVEFSVYQDTATAISVVMLRHPAGGGTGVARETVASTTATGPKTVSLVVAHLIEDGFVYALQVTTTNANNEIYSAKVSHHKDA